jgi:uncharacterized integral membrane protein
MTKKQIMNWVWDHPLTVTIIISIPVGVVVIAIALKTYII